MHGSQSGNRNGSRDPLEINRSYSDTTGTRNARANTGSDNTDSVQGPDTRMDVSDPLTQLINNVAATVPANYQI